MKELKRNGFLGRFGAIAMSIAMLAALPSCGPADKVELNRSGKVMVIGKTDPKEDSYWKDVKSGALDAGEEMGYTVTYQTAENESDIESQKKFIKQAIDEQYDVIVLAPNSSTELNDDLKAAKNSGIKIININSKCDYEGVECLVASSDGAAASSCCDEVIRLMRERNEGKLAGVGKIALIPHNGNTVESRITVFRNRLASEIMKDLQESGQSITGASTGGSKGDNGVALVLDDGTELLFPEEAANRAAAAASKQGLKGDAIVEAANAAAEEAAAALKDAGYDLGERDGGDGRDGGDSESSEGGSGSGDPTANMMTPDEAAQKALEEAKKDPNIPPSEYANIATAAAEKQAAEIARIKAGAGGGDQGEQGGQTNEDGAPVDINGVPDPAYDMQTPNEAATAAVEAAKKAGNIPTSKFSELAEKAAQDQIKAIAEAREKVGYIVSEEQKAQENASSSSTNKNYFQQLQDEYFIEANHCNTSYEAYEETRKLLDPDNDGTPDETGIKVLYATNTNTTIGACQAVDQLGLSDDVIVVGYNTDDKELDYINSGILDATILSNPYNVGYLGVIYAKKLVDGNKVNANIETGVTLLTPDNFNDDYVQILLNPDKTLSIAASSKKKKTETSKNEEGGEGEEVESNSEEDAATPDQADGGNE